MILSRFDENAMKSFDDVFERNPSILEQLRKETEEWMEELQERKRYTNG